jgi:NTE family protein
MTGRLAAGVLLMVLAACAAPTRNVELTVLDDNAGYRFHTINHGTRDVTLVVMTMSGGGTRAAALATGALRGLQAATFADQTPLAGEIDILSSVSGGSVTAAYFARHGYDGLAQLEHDFLRQDIIGDLFAAGLNPINLARLPTPSYARIDWLIAAFRKRLFAQDVRYRALLQNQTNQPYLILNAGDVTAETPFPFTQDRFDLICSDLLDMELSQAVAASAAFPGALTALTLTNYAPCAAQEEAWPDHPPLRIINPLSTSVSDNPQARRRAVREWGYLNRAYPDDYLDAAGEIDNSRPPRRKDWQRALPVDARRQYIHLLDGGTTDNLGLSEPLYLVSASNAQALVRGQDGALKNVVQAICERDIRTILFVVVNARADQQSALDRSATPPGIFSTIVGTTSSAIDGTTYGLLDRLDTVTKDLVRLNRSCDPQAVEDLVVLSVPVDFDFIDDPVCRATFQNMATSWALPGAAVDALLDAGSAMVVRGLKAAPRDNSRPSAAARLGLEIKAGPTLAGACKTAATAD